MALTYTMDGPNTGPRILGYRKRVWTGTITLDGSYATGGYSLAPSTTGVVSGAMNPFGMPNTIESLNVESFHTKYLFSWDQANQKLKVYIKQIKTSATATADSVLGAKLVDNTGTEVAGTWLGNSAASTAYDVINHAEASANDANLSGVVIRVRVEGW